jgi:type II secretory pathway predicted ATPase ExeA/uncharacterized coiled-coil protein SlyX
LAQGEGFVVLTGEVGAGKSALVAHLLATIDQDQMTTAQIVGGHLGGAYLADDYANSGQTIPSIARAFGLTADALPGLTAETRTPFMLDANLSFLRDEVRAGRRCLLVVDDAQALPIAAFETLRLMSLFQLDDRPLLQILLVGQTELLTRLQCHPDLEPLRQRVAASHHLDPLELGEVERYIHHRLKCVGWNGNPTFAPHLHAELFAESGGVPGRINQLVDRLLLLGATQQQAHIDGAMLTQVLAQRASHATGAGEETAYAGPCLKTRLEVALARCEGQIAELQQAVVELAGTSENHAQPARYRQDSSALQERLASLESRMIEQERTIRHTLTMLIEWIERDEAHSVAA